jgi:transcriptional regulator with XRE-family HTH domain
MNKLTFIYRRARELGLYEYDVARKMRLPRADLDRIEHGRKMLGSEALAKLARILEVPADRLRSELAKDARALNVLRGVSSLTYRALCDQRPLPEILAAAGIDYDSVFARGHGLTHDELLAVADELRLDRATVEADLDAQLGGF